MSDHNRDELTRLLRRIDEATEVPASDPDREAALMAAFDVRRSAEREAEASHDIYSTGRMRWLAAAAVIAMAIGSAISWRTSRPSEIAARPAAAVTAAAPGLNEFVPWPGSSALPRFESGQLVRMDLPASMLPSLGFFPPASDANVVRADVLIGQDGLARAVRLLPPATDNEGLP